MAATAPPPTPFVLDTPTLLSLGFALSLMPLAYLLSFRFLSRSTSFQNRVLFLWHSYDAMTHFFIEGSYLYHCFFSYITIPSSPSGDYPHPASLAADGVYFLGHRDRRYGSWYSNSASARLWQEYAKADKRWGGADLTVISLEILTVFLCGPFALYICFLLSELSSTAISSLRRSKMTARLYVFATVLATMELYGGFITFAPEWLSGNANLDTSNWMYLYFYLVFFNILWVFIPLWILWISWGKIEAAFKGSSQSGKGKKGH
jgi:hypothetical protein